MVHSLAHQYDTCKSMTECQDPSQLYYVISIIVNQSCEGLGVAPKRNSYTCSPKTSNDEKAFSVGNSSIGNSVEIVNFFRDF